MALLRLQVPVDLFDPVRATFDQTARVGVLFAFGFPRVNPLAHQNSSGGASRCGGHVAVAHLMADPSANGTEASVGERTGK